MFRQTLGNRHLEQEFAQSNLGRGGAKIGCESCDEVLDRFRRALTDADRSVVVQWSGHQPMGSERGVQVARPRCDGYLDLQALQACCCESRAPAGGVK